MNRSFAACISMPPGGFKFRAVFAITLIGVPNVFRPQAPHLYCSSGQSRVAALQLRRESGDDAWPHALARQLR